MLDKPMLAVLDNNDRLQCLTDEYFDSCLHTFLQGTAAFFTCSVLQTSEIAQYFKVGNKLSFVSNDVNYHFDITKMHKNEQLVTIQADSLTLELRNEFASEYKASKAMTFKQYLDVFLFAGDNPLVMGINEVSDKSLQTEWTGDSDSVLARLFSLANKFDAEIEFETVLNKHWGLDKVRLNVYRAHSDKYQGIGKKRTDIIMEYGNNVETVEYEENIDDLKTAILPIGTDGLLIGNVVIDEKDKNGNQLFLSIKTDNYIRAVQSRDRFRSKMGSFDGYIAKRWTYETTNENVLAGQALAELKKLCEPKVTVTIKGYEYLGIGDTVLVQNTAYVPTLNLSARISEQEIYFDDPSKNSSTFTNVEILQSQVDQSLLDRVNVLIERTKPYTLSLVSDNGVTFKNSEGKTTLSAIVYNGTQVITPDVTVRWYKDDVWVKTGYTLEVKASDINAKAVYKAIVIDTNGNERATQEVTMFNVDDGKGIKGKPVLSYASSGSINTVPTTWQATIPSVPAGSYLWTREVTTYSDDTTSEVITPVLQGPKGDPGSDGVAGKDGIGIKSTQIMYAGSDSGTVKPTAGWTSDVPVLAAGKYLWTETTWLYSDNTGESGYSVSRIGKDGNTGADGIAGKDGVGIANTTITYATSTSGTTAPTSGYTQSVPSVAEGSFLWTKTVWTYTDGTNETGYSVAKQGARGADGKDGKGIIDSKQEWAASTSGTTAPTTWQTTIPTVTAGQYLWSRITETWSDNNKTYKFTIGKIGENGQKAQMMFLSADKNTMMFNADNTAKFAQTATITAKYQNVSGTVAFTAKGIKEDGTSDTLTLTGSGDSRTITSAMFKTDWVMITVTATLDSLSDTISIMKVNDGADGAGGKDGYFHSAWAMSADGKTGFSTTTSAGKYYIGTYFDFVKEDSTDPTRYNWVELANAIGMHFAYAWSKDGTDRFTTVYPNENLILGANASSKSGFFKNFDLVRDGYGEITMTSANNNYAIMPLWEGYSVKVRDYPVGAKVTISFEIMYTKWDFPYGTWTQEFWFGQRYGNGPEGSTGRWSGVTQVGLPKIGDDGRVLNTWYSVSTTVTIPERASDGVDDQTALQFYNPSTTSASFTARIRNPKIEYSANKTLFTTNPKDDYDNAIPRYVGRSLKDSSGPSDYTWEVNPDRRPWVGYMQELDGTGFSKVPYNTNLWSNTSGDVYKKVTVSSTDILYRFPTPNKDLYVGKTVTISAYLKPTLGYAYVQCWYRLSNGNQKWEKGAPIYSGKEGLSSVTFLFPNDVDGYNFVIMNSEVVTTETSIEYKADKLEVGPYTPWTPTPSEDPLGAIPKYVGTAALPYTDYTKYAWYLNPSWLQQESNNNLANKVDNNTYNNERSNVWTEISNRVTKEEAQAIQKSLDKVTGAYTDFVSTGGKHDQDLANLKSAINTDIQKLADKVLGFDFVNTWFRIGDGGLSIGEANSNFEILVSNDQITFYDSGTAVAYVSNQSFFINSGMIVDDLQIGKFKFAKVNDNLMGLFHIA